MGLKNTPQASLVFELPKVGAGIGTQKGSINGNDGCSLTPLRLVGEVNMKLYTESMLAIFIAALGSGCF